MDRIPEPRRHSSCSMSNTPPRSPTFLLPMNRLPEIATESGRSSSNGGGPPDGGQTGSLLGTGGPPSSRGVSPAISRFFPSPKRKVCTMDCEKCRRDMTSQLRIDQESQLNLALSAPCSRKSSAAANGKPRSNNMPIASLFLDSFPQYLPTPELAHS